MSNAFPIAVVTFLLGMGIGTLVTGFVTEHNTAYYATQNRKQMVELGVGYYDSRTGVFITKACTK